MTGSDVLVVDDHPAAALALAHPLRARFQVLVASTVAEAVAVLRRVAVAAVVLDLLLDADASPLHREILLRGTPVVVVSGLEGAAARVVARVWGAPALLKPVPDDTLLAAVTDAASRSTSPETTTMPDTHTPTMAPPPPADPPLPPPPTTPADMDSVSPLAATSPAVAVAEAWSRTLRRTVATLAVTGLALYFESRGHSVPLPVVAALTVLGIGVSGAVAALRKRPAVAAGGAAGLVALALGGTVLGLDEASTLATLGAGAIPVVDLLADRVRGA